jgi:hypothetical protein
LYAALFGAAAFEEPEPELAPGTELTFETVCGSTEDLRVVKVLGDGGWSTVYEVVDQHNKYNRYALKVGKKYGDDASEAASQKSLTQEADLMQVSLNAAGVGQGVQAAEGNGVDLQQDVSCHLLHSYSAGVALVACSRVQLPCKHTCWCMRPQSLVGCM